jgi:hypothetical protein
MQVNKFHFTAVLMYETLTQVHAYAQHQIAVEKHMPHYAFLNCHIWRNMLWDKAIFHCFHHVLLHPSQPSRPLLQLNASFKRR